MIRILKTQEVELLVPGGHAFFAEGKLPGQFNPEFFCKRWREMISDGSGVVFGLFDESGAIQGALGAVFYDDILTGDKLTTELMWFCFPEHRGHGKMLLDTYLGYSTRRGVARLNMIHLQGLHPEILKKLYERKGFRHVESGYMKELK